MIKYISITLLLFFYFNLVAQKKKKDDTTLFADHAQWYEGSIILTDGSELKGLVKYNSASGVLSYQDGTESRVFTPLKVAGFEFFDESLQRQRVFYTLVYEDAETNVPRPLFFEVLKEYKLFAVLAKSDRLDVGQKPDVWTNPGNSLYTKNTTLVISQTETMYVMSSSGEIKPYFKVVNSEDGRMSAITGKDSKTQNKMIDRDLLEEFIPPSEFQQLKKYAKDNDLNFKIKADLLQILNYYDGIISK